MKLPRSTGATSKNEATRIGFKAAERAAETNLSQAVISELLRSGVIGEDGKAILVPGPAGADSQVPGPKGDSIVGPTGRDAVDGKPGRDAKIALGSVVAGEEASVILREDNGVQVLDFVLPRGERGEAGATGASVVGPKGDSIVGPEGQQGIPGAGFSKDQGVSLIEDMKRRGYFRN